MNSYIALGGPLGINFIDLDFIGLYLSRDFFSINLYLSQDFFSISLFYDI
jgi:hypothetical protein